MNLKSHAMLCWTAQNSLPDCPKCNVRPKIEYEPGCAFAACECQKWAVPEEDWHGIARVIRKDLAEMKLEIEAI